MTTVQKPNVKQVKALEKKNISTAISTAEHNNEEALKKFYNNKNELSEKTINALTTSENERDENISSAQEDINDAEAVVEIAKLVLKAAKENLSTTKSDAKSKISAAKAAFNSEAEKLNAEEKKELLKLQAEINAKKQDGKGLVKSAKQHKKETVSVVRKDRNDYIKYAFNTAVEKIENGVVAVVEAVTKAFKEGFEKETTVKVPENLKKYQQ